MQAGPWTPALRQVHAALEAALAAGGPDVEVELGTGARLRLLTGDARAVLPDEGPPFDAVFLDPFSPATDRSLWQPEFLARVAARMAPGSWLSTYTASLRVRRALLAAGLRVGRGTARGGQVRGDARLARPDAAAPLAAPAAKGAPGRPQGSSGRSARVRKGFLRPPARDRSGRID